MSVESSNVPAFERSSVPSAPRAHERTNARTSAASRHPRTNPRLWLWLVGLQCLNAAVAYGAWQVRPSQRELVRAGGTVVRRGDLDAVERIVQRVCDGVCDAFSVEPVLVDVLEVRPSFTSHELHGLYTPEEGPRPKIRVWMRTAKHGRVVAHRTFVRTLVHELCHHLDYTLLELEESFHTEGFFKRESSLCRQLLPPRERRGAGAAEE